MPRKRGTGRASPSCCLHPCSLLLLLLSPCSRSSSRAELQLSPAPAVGPWDHCSHAPGGNLILAYPVGAPGAISPLMGGKHTGKALERREGKLEVSPGGFKALWMLMGARRIDGWTQLQGMGDSSPGSHSSCRAPVAVPAWNKAGELSLKQ